LRHGPIALERFAFSFTLSRAVTVRATLSVRAGPNGHRHWRKLPGSITISAIKGINRRRLHGLGTLMPGAYRLTLLPVGGSARSISVRVG
jgi:hypothetical protein